MNLAGKIYFFRQKVAILEEQHKILVEKGTL